MTAAVGHALIPSSTVVLYEHEIRRSIARARVSSLVTTIGGELLGSQLLITVGAVGFVISLLALFAVMSVVLAVGVARTPVMSAPTRRSLKEFVDILPA